MPKARRRRVRTAHGEQTLVRIDVDDPWYGPHHEYSLVIAEGEVRFRRVEGALDVRWTADYRGRLQSAYLRLRGLENRLAQSYHTSLTDAVEHVGEIIQRIRIRGIH